MSVEQCSQCLKEAMPPVRLMNGEAYCIKCASLAIAVAMERLAAAIRKQCTEGRE